ncbi:uncharacterized protein [Cardiocondyla obscurior]|uniref:uncharacterized protein isoform X2 n=1 Tax=Cardiocondyla obscurior TaxID=286306 RepID=UPI0039658482
MVNPSSVVAHLVKLLVTIVCMKYLTEPYQAKALPITWSMRAFRILFMHSVLGIFRYGMGDRMMFSTFINIKDSIWSSIYVVIDIYSEMLPQFLRLVF